MSVSFAVAANQSGTINFQITALAEADDGQSGIAAEAAEVFPFATWLDRRSYLPRPGWPWLLSESDGVGTTGAC
jgi:hypothetical protein